ncbi:MAG: HNH endonuclease family protein [Chloroflexi bacterium]|nr:HNH endonuclease family protein [Chloroflexota bacterium]MCY4246578.1 HNH endonuclease family protein [Chloroflexota bacterium]
MRSVRTRINKDYQSVEAFIQEIHELHRFSGYYDLLLRPANENDSQIQISLVRLQRADSVTAFPLVLFLYDLYHQNVIEKAEFCEALHLIENFIIRVFLSGGSTTGLNQTFPSLVAKLDESEIIQSLRMGICNQRRYPSDNRIRQSLAVNTMYDFKRQSRLIFVLENINQQLSSGKGGYTLLDDVATIEHIMPRKLTREWQLHLGKNWEADHREYFNTIGNLTILSQKWNSSISNGSFEKKKAKLSANELRINKDYFSRDIETWNASEILQRSGQLADLALKIWPALPAGQTTDDYTGRIPVAITIDGVKIPVESWAEVTVRTAEQVFARVDDTAQFAEKHTGLNIPYFRRSYAKYYKRMSNGWYVYVNRYATSHVNFCKELVSSSGLDAADWDVEVEANMP